MVITRQWSRNGPSVIHVHTTTEPAGTRSPRAVASVLVFLGIVSTAVAALGAPLLPTIVVVDHVSLAASQWALTISLLVGAVTAPVLGRLGDGRMRRPVILVTVGVVLVGCVVSALPGGFTGLLAGRALQGIGLGLVPLAIAAARDCLPTDRRGPTIALLGVTTAIGIGIGYPVVGLVTEYLGMAAAFWVGAGVSAVALASAAAVLPASGDRPGRHVDMPGALLLGGGVTAVLLALAEGQSWGWASPGLIGVVVAAVVLVACWVMWELRAAHPLVDVRLLRHRVVLGANATALLVGVGIYPLLSLVVRLVQTPTATGYGFGASPLVAGLMLVPFSLASFASNRTIGPMLRRGTPEQVVAWCAVGLLGTMVLFLFARSTVWELAIVMALAGYGIGCVFAANPLQIVRGVPAGETASATGFYQVLRSVGFSVGSALSATALVVSVPAGQTLPASDGYRTAALIGIGIMVAGTVVAALFARKPSGRVTGASPS